MTGWAWVTSRPECAQGLCVWVSMWHISAQDWSAPTIKHTTVGMWNSSSPLRTIVPAHRRGNNSSRFTRGNHNCRFVEDHISRLMGPEYSFRFMGGDHNSRLTGEVIISVMLVPAIFLLPSLWPHDYTSLRKRILDSGQQTKATVTCWLEFLTRGTSIVEKTAF